MTGYDFFIDEVLSLQVKTVANEIDFKHYREPVRNYEDALRRAKAQALTDLLDKPSAAISKHLTRLQGESQRLTNFLALLKRFANDSFAGKLDETDFLLTLNCYFSCSVNPGWRVSYRAIHDLVYLVGLKRGIINGLIKDVEKHTTALPVTTKPKKREPKTLIDIWETGDARYNWVMERLKEVYSVTGYPFLNENGEWNQHRNFTKYIAAFIKACIDNKDIKSGYSAPVLQTVLQNTFKIQFNHRPLVSIEAKEIPEKYTDPFIRLAPKK